MATQSIQRFIEKFQNASFAGLIGAVVLAAFMSQLLPFLADASALPLPNVDSVDIAKPEGDTALERAESFLGPAARAFRIIMAAVAVMLLVFAGVTMVIRGESEEGVKEQKKAISFGVAGLLMISIAGPLAQVFDYRQGNLLADDETLLERVQLFNDTTQVMITFMKYVLGSLATLMIARAGAVLVAQGSSEEIVTREKKSLATSIGALALVIVSDLAIRKVVFVAEYNEEIERTIVSIDESEFSRQLVGITNLIVSFVGPVMMLSIVVGGLLYVTAAGNEERQELAKKIVKNSVIGVIIIYGAFAITTTVITGVF